MILPRNLFLTLTILTLSLKLHSQYADHPLPQYPEEWNARWITHPDIDQAAYGVILFRNEFLLREVPEQYIVHVSGDNRYRIYVNGVEVCYGPQLADIRHWRYESIDISEYLNSGNNIVSAEVINWGIDRSYGIISNRTAFLVQPHSEKEAQLATGYNNNWKVFKNEGVFEKPVHWMTSGEIVGGFYAANPTDSIVADKYPWGWKGYGFDVSDWKKPEVIFSQPKTEAGAGHGWILQARTTPIQVTNIERFNRIARTDIEDLGETDEFGERSISIPANSSRFLLIDQGYLTLGYPKLQLSGGKGASIKIIYSEALYDAENHKGNRNELEGKTIKGISDIYLMDGGHDRIFQPLWLRTFRFIKLEIKTDAEPLLIDDYYNLFSASPIPLKASFNCDDIQYERIWNLCWHGLKICAQDNLLSDAYYEQMQYVGDLRPHLMAWTALTGDLSYFRSALEQFNNSRLPDGNITSCYPLKATFVHPPYSLIWIDMVHELMMLDGNRALIASYESEMQEVFDYYESLINESGLVGKSNYLMFIDWYMPKGGNSRANKDGNSAILTLNYAYTLKKASEIEKWLGNEQKANDYLSLSKSYAQTVRKLCFVPEKGIYSDDPENTYFDQRASILAVLTGAHSKQESELLMKHILDTATHFDSYANLFYYFYLFEAMELTDQGNFSAQLGPWKDIADMGMTATPEKRIEQHPRSEVHPWSAHPVHFFYSLVAGIRPASPGFRTVTVAPNPGTLKHIDGSYPCKHGNILFDFKFRKDKLKGDLTLPENMSGEFRWKGKVLSLNPGLNEINL